MKNGKTKLVKKDLQELIENVTKYFFDKNLFNGKDHETIKQSHESFGDIKRYGVNLTKLYEKWDPAAVKTYEPDIRLEEIEKIFLPEK